jgi:hypothetical protein
VKSFQSQTYYELLEISVGASSDEIRGAFERLTRLYSDDQVVLYGLIESGQAALLRERLHEALEVLGDELRRATYDASIGLPPRELPAPPSSPPPPPPSLTPPALRVVVPGGSPHAVAPRSSSRPSASTPGWSGISWVTAAPSPTPLPPAQLLHLDGLGGSHSGRAAVAPPAVPLAARPPPPVAPPAPDARYAPDSPYGPDSSYAPRVATPSLEAPVVAFPRAPVNPVPEAGGDLPKPPVIEPTAELAPEAPPPPPLAEPVRLGEAPQVVARVEVPDREPARAELPAEAPARPRDFRPEPKVKPFELAPGAEFNGDLLRQVRMAHGVSMAQLAEKTRISVRHLENLEADRYDALPASVYLRGILISVARELGLDGARVARSYLSFVEARRSKG